MPDVITAIKDLPTYEVGTAEYIAQAHGLVRYNGRSFNSFRRVQLEGQEVYDEAGWAVTHIRYALTIGTTVFAADEASMGSLMTNLRADLSEPGRQLVLKDIGLGDIVVNDPSLLDATPLTATHYDVEWGPKPQVLSMESVGALRAIEIVWRCTFSISECASGGITAPQAVNQPFLALNYTASYRTSNGLTTRSITGYAQVPMTRQAGGDSAVIASADDVLDRLNVPLPIGFRRGDIYSQLSSDRRRLDFSFEDRQLSGPPLPDGCVDAEADYTLGNSTPLVFEQWNGTLQASFEVAPGVAKSKAAKAFYDLCIQTLASLGNAVTDTSPNNFVLLRTITARNSLFSNKASFSASFFAAGCLEAVLGPGGLWAPVNTNYATWAASMAGVWSNRGTAQLRHTPTGAITSLCSSVSLAAIAADAGAGPIGTGDFQGAVNTNIPEDGGWLGYKNRLVAYREQSATVQQSLNAYVPPPEQEQANGVGFSNATNEAKSEIQYNGAPTKMVLMVGKAMRVQHLPIVPVLTNIQGQTPRRLVEVIDGPEVIACYFGLKVYFVRWAILYALEDAITLVPEQPRKTGCCDD